MLTDQELLRYSRQILLQQVDIDGQLKLKHSRVLIVRSGRAGFASGVVFGRGGVWVNCMWLTSIHVDVTNLQRQIIHDTASVGQNKVDSAMARLAAINPEITLLAHRCALDADSLAKAVDARGGFSARLLR